MASKSHATILAIAAALALVLIVANFIGAGFNRSAQVKVNQRQQFINQGIEVGRINQTLIHALAIAAVRHDDPQLQDLLQKQGITVNVAPTAPPAPGAAATAAPGTHQP